MNVNEENPLMSTLFTERALRDLQQKIQSNPDLLRYKNAEDESEPQETSALLYEDLSKLSIPKLIYAENIRISDMYADTRSEFTKLECEYDDMERKHTSLKAEHNNLCLDHHDLKEQYDCIRKRFFSLQVYWAGCTLCSLCTFLCYVQFVC